MTIVRFPNHDYGKWKALRTICFAVIAAGSSALAYYCLHRLPLKASYTDFYATYDPMASFHRMRDGGYLDSCPKPEEDKNKKKK